MKHYCREYNETSRPTLKWKNLATHLGVILGKSLKRTSYDIKKHRITKYFCVIFFYFKAFSCFPKCYEMENLIFTILALARLIFLSTVDKMLSYRRETALQGAVQFSPNVEDWNCETIFYGHYRSIFNNNRPENLSNSVKKRKIRAITAFKVIQGHRGRYQSKARMRFAISD